MQKTNYIKFLVMLTISFVIMYSVMFLNVDQLDHVYLSATRCYMSLMMVSPMSVLMIAMMGGMYPDKRKNRIIQLFGILVFIVALLLLRTQTLIEDKQYMQAMIPHHSSAIMTSKHAHIQDPEVRQLADSIIASQHREIEQMKRILQRLP